MPGMAMPREPLSLGAALGLGAGNALLNFGGSMIGAAFNRDAANEALDRQVNATKALYAWQQKHYLSPKAQLENVAEAGLMPSSQFGNHSPINVGGQMVSPTAPSYGLAVGTQSLGDIAQLLVGAAQAKKAGVEIPKIEEDTKNQMLNNERQEFENMLLSKYGLKRTAAEVALAAQNVKLAMAQTDVTLQDKAVKEWQAVKEKAESEVSGTQRDILRKELANKDIELDIRNRQGEANIGLTKSQSAAASASAAASRAQVSYLGALTQSVNELRSGQIKAQDLANDLSEISKMMAKRENVRDAATHQDKISIIVSEMEQKKLINETTRQQINKLMQENDWYAVQQVCGVMSSVVGAYGGTINALSNQEKVSIQREIAGKMNQNHSRWTYGADGKVKGWTEDIYE